MSFTTAEPKAIVLSAMGGDWEEWSSSAEPTDSGFDTISVSLAKDFRAGGTNGLAIARQFPIGRRIGASNFWITGCKPRLIAGGIWGCDLQGKGLVATRPIKVSGGTGVEQQSTENYVFVPGVGGTNRLQTLEITPTVNVEYISFNPPATNQVGQAGYSPYVTAVRNSVWTSLSNPLVHFPFGWVMVDMQWEKLSGVNVWLIKEVWQYIYRYSV